MDTLATAAASSKVPGAAAGFALASSVVVALAATLLLAS